MDLAKPGLIQQYCLPNAILTFQEYLEDYASDGTRGTGNRLVRSMLDEIPTEDRRTAVKDRIERIKAGERDLYF